MLLAILRVRRWGGRSVEDFARERVHAWNRPSLDARLKVSKGAARFFGMAFMCRGRVLTRRFNEQSRWVPMVGVGDNATTQASLCVLVEPSNGRVIVRGGGAGDVIERFGRRLL